MRQRATVVALVWMMAGLALGPRARAADGAVLDLQNTVTEVAERVRPSVVSITAEQERPRVNVPLPPGSPTPRFGAARGTGMIYRDSPDAWYVMTNAHVVRGARSREVKVQILAEREEREGTVLALDSRTDTAVVKLARKPGDSLRPVTIGKVDELRPGNFVIAVGSPFGFESSISFGVISGLDRELREPTEGRDPKRQAEVYRGLIQTDASINPGNSGGPLVNLRGEVVGINFAIYSPGVAGNVGVGFAIPIDRAVRSADDIIAHGRVRRGYLGVLVGDLAEQARSNQATLEQLRAALGVDEGAFVQEVVPGTPAAKAGVQAGDVITGLDGQPIVSQGDLVDKIGNVVPGTTVKLDIVRAKQRLSLDLTLAELEGTGAPATNGDEPAAPAWEKDPLGLTVVPLPAERGAELKIEQGVLVSAVDAAGLGAARGITADTVLLRGTLNDQTTVFDAVARYHEFIGAAQKEKALVVIWYNAPGADENAERRESSVLLRVPSPDDPDD